MTRSQAQEITRLLADPTRFRIFETIAARKDEMRCADLLPKIKITPATMSHHLKELAEAGLIDAHRQAKYMHIKANRSTWRAYLAHLRKLA